MITTTRPKTFRKELEKQLKLELTPEQKKIFESMLYKFKKAIAIQKQNTLIENIESNNMVKVNGVYYVIEGIDQQIFDDEKYWVLDTK